MVAREHWIVIIDDEEEGGKAFQICHSESHSVQFLGCQGHRGRKMNKEPTFTGHPSTLLTGAWEALFKFYFKTV